MTSYEDFSCLYNLYNETMCSLAFYLWFGFTCIVFASRPLTKPTQYWSWPPQSTSREVELNTLDLGSPMGATQWGSGTCILGPGLVSVLTMLEGLGSVYGLWVKITVARSNRKWGCQEEEVYAGVVYRKTHAQSFTSKFNSDINTLRGNKCEQLNQNQPFTFLWFLKFTHSLASLTHPSSTHLSLPLQEVKKVNSDISSTATPSLATVHPNLFECTAKKNSLACPEDLNEYPDSILLRCPEWTEVSSGHVKGSASFILNWGYLQNTSWVSDHIYFP